MSIVHPYNENKIKKRRQMDISDEIVVIFKQNSLKNFLKNQKLKNNFDNNRRKKIVELSLLAKF